MDVTMSPIYSSVVVLLMQLGPFVLFLTAHGLIAMYTGMLERASLFPASMKASSFYGSDPSLLAYAGLAALAQEISQEASHEGCVVEPLLQGMLTATLAH